MDKTDVLKVTDSVNWIGVLDHDLVTFDIVMETKMAPPIIPTLSMLKRKQLLIL